MYSYLLPRIVYDFYVHTYAYIVSGNMSHIHIYIYIYIYIYIDIYKSLIESKSLLVFYIYIINIYKTKRGKGEGKLDQDLTLNHRRSTLISVQSEKKNEDSVRTEKES